MAGVCVSCVFLFFLLLSCVGTGYCQYQQIDLTSSGVECGMDSIFSGIQSGTSLDCHGAINNNTGTTWRDTHSTDPNCIYTLKTSGNHYWQVSLAQPRNIHKITIYPEAKWNYTGGIAVSVDGTVVFMFPTGPKITTAQDIILDPPRAASVIKLSKTDDYVTLCELQVYGCESGRYGTGCQQTCPVGCQPDTCDSVAGHCTCKTGWQAPLCTGCASGYHRSGDDCVLCGDGCQDTCHTDTGQCTCRTGWAEHKCTSCADGWYGASCDLTCSAGCNNTCNKQDGTCTCRTGWTGDKCDVCSPGHYAPNSGCKACGAGCQDVTSCDTTSGSCRCLEGWEPPTCHGCKSGLWGDNCSSSCGNCGGDGSCHKTTGECKSVTTEESNTGIIVGSVVGVGVLICITIVVVAVLVIRSRRSRNSRNNLETSIDNRTPKPAVKVSSVELSEGPVAELATRAEGDGSDNYDKLTQYENNPDDFKPYDMLQTDSNNYEPVKVHQNPDDVKPYDMLQTDLTSKQTPQGRKSTHSDGNTYENPEFQYENTVNKP